jgi:hypothetical protein
VIGSDKKIKLTLTYPASTGRNFAEILRVIDSLQLTAKHKLATPANWEPGQDCIITMAVKDEEIPALFPKGSRRVKPYFALHAAALKGTEPYSGSRKSACIPPRMDYFSKCSSH